MRILGLVVAVPALVLAGYTYRTVDRVPGGNWAALTSSPPVRLDLSVWGLTEQDVVAGSFREVGRTEQAVVFVWLLPSGTWGAGTVDLAGRWGAGVADLSGRDPMSVRFHPHAPTADPPATEAMGGARNEIWTTLFTVEGEEPLDLRCGRWEARLFHLGEADGQRGPYGIYLAMAGDGPPGEPQLQVQRATGTAVEQLSNWGRVPGPNPQDCAAS
ncbi:hypothetical protein ACFV4P_35360 [Kitasatospora sp. NPDC059795]|uniref:hypothetical protein n=1 Tax=Kitasatospora sp. NPDC059795 TaxID=3346949 RepID=UPI003657E46D